MLLNQQKLTYMSKTYMKYKDECQDPVFRLSLTYDLVRIRRDVHYSLQSNYVLNVKSMV